MINILNYLIILYWSCLLYQCLFEVFFQNNLKTLLQKALNIVIFHMIQHYSSKYFLFIHINENWFEALNSRNLTNRIFVQIFSFHKTLSVHVLQYVLFWFFSCDSGWSHAKDEYDAAMLPSLKETKTDYLSIRKMLMKKLLLLKIPVSYPVCRVEMSQGQVLKQQGS